MSGGAAARACEHGPWTMARALGRPLPFAGSPGPFRTPAKAGSQRALPALPAALTRKNSDSRAAFTLAMWAGGGVWQPGTGAYCQAVSCVGGSRWVAARCSRDSQELGLHGGRPPPRPAPAAAHPPGAQEWCAGPQQQRRTRPGAQSVAWVAGGARAWGRGWGWEVAERAPGVPSRTPPCTAR
jgi:hypothetical protein